ncbi:hypothetical protein E6H36_08385 [Candidatus Bathyarchaeota archaeon]|nr:MAG: hypothetical protein E6H36_08385 [Candidatus Bathyarchaeota archaeon]TMI29638.1 MAG: hypothetical protein E6H29_10930 [Candidatus Bathyarchaeota archaeon]
MLLTKEPVAVGGAFACVLAYAKWGDRRIGLLDPVGLVISSIVIIGGIVGIYRLRKLRRSLAFGLGGSITMLGLITLARTYDLISGTALWVTGGAVLIVFASFFYLIVKKSSTS